MSFTISLFWNGWLPYIYKCLGSNKAPCHSLPGNELIQKCVQVIRPTVLVDPTTQMCYAKLWLGIAIHSTAAKFYCKSLSLQNFRSETCNVVIWPADAIRHKTDRHLSSLDFPSRTTRQIWTKNMQYFHCNKDSLTNLKVKVICMLQPNKPQNPISSRTVTFR